MKNKESKNNFHHSMNLKKSGIKIDSKEASKIKSTGKSRASQSAFRKKEEDVPKTQVERMKKFYYTTRWLPNTAFTTYFGKPAFENYGYGNTKPVYGGLFYGNYLLSHNINPVEGDNNPETKQVYSSAMLKALQNSNIRKPSPPRKTPDEIRNTPEELEEISHRKPIFQLPNQFPSRGIIKPNLIKSRYFRSGKNTPNDSFDNNTKENEMFDIQDVVNNKLRKLPKKKISSSHSDFNPFNQSKPNLNKKKIKENLDHQFKKNESMKNIKENLNANREDDEYYLKKQFYEKMLKEGDDNNLDENYEQSHKFNKIYQFKEEKEIQTSEDFSKHEESKIENNCSHCRCSFILEQKGRSHKNENPCLKDPQHVFVCCSHNLMDPLSIVSKDPKNYKYLPPCTLDKINPAGKPLKYSEPLGNLLR